MPAIKEQMNAAVEKATKIINKAQAEKRNLTAVEDKEYDRLKVEIEVLNKLGAEPVPTLAAHRDPIGHERQHNSEGQTVALNKSQRMADLVARSSDEPKLSIGKYIRGLVTGDWSNAIPEMKAMSEGTLSGGGYMVPDLLSAEIIDLARNHARVMQAGAMIVPMTSNKLTIARVTGDLTAAWKAENAVSPSSNLTFDAVHFQARTLMAMAKMSIELMDDAQNIDAVVSNAIALALALELDRAALYGSGTGAEPLGLRNATGILTSSMGVNGAAMTNYDSFSQSVQAIREFNGEPNSVIYAPRTAGEIDRLKDTLGQPLQAPESFKALGKYSTNQVPTNLTQGSATTASDAFVGDFSQLLIGSRKNIQIEVSREASDGTDHAFFQYMTFIRATLRADVQVAHPKHFDIIEGIL